MRDNFRELMTRELTRKQFLQLLLAGLLAIFGFNNLINFLLHSNQRPHNVSEADHGFGSRRFGV